MARIVSDEGYGKNDYIETQRPLVVITAPGPGSGKMATCLSQLYHEHKRGVKAGYAKFETFPIWNLPLKHPVNLAYEAATADLNDVNMIDPFHLEAYGVTTVNYNRDIEIFPVVNAMFELIARQKPLQVPHRHGREHGRQLHHGRRGLPRGLLQRDHPPLLQGPLRPEEPARTWTSELLQAGAADESGRSWPSASRPVEKQAARRGRAHRRRARRCHRAAGRHHRHRQDRPPAGRGLLCPAERPQEAGRHRPGDRPASPPSAIEPIQTLKTNYLGSRNPRLHTDEILIALSSSAAENETAAIALRQLSKLKGCDMHSTVILSSVDTDTLKRLGMYLTCEPAYEQEDRKYHKL